MIDRLQRMIDRLQHALPDMELLPEPAQEELAIQIEGLLEQLEDQKKGQRETKKSMRKEWKNPVGSWADMPDTIDQMFDAFEKIRHANPPSSPIELP